MPDAGLRLTDPVFRAHNPLWSWDPLSGDGARRRGGRFNARGRPALYTSLDPVTALREASSLGAPLQPLTLCEYVVDARPVLDATDPAALAAEGIDPAELASDWRRDRALRRLSPSQALGERLAAGGWCGMIVPSFAVGAAPGARNVVFWTWSDAPPTLVRVVDDERRLPPPPG